MGAAQGDHWIGGAWRADAPGGLAEIRDPASGAPVGTAPTGSAALAGAAVAAARAAFETAPWASEPRRRAAALLDFADRLEAAAGPIAELMSRENGKLIAQARHEVAAGVSEARYYAGLARNVFGRTFEPGAGKLALLTREPAGVAAVIVPWNAPVTLLVRSLAPALAAGCTAVIKPAPQTPLTNAAVIGCLAGVEALPAGAVNSVNECGTEVGRALCTHPEVDVISFTGSSRTGKAIMEGAAATVKHVGLELGGKAPAVVFADADMDRALAEVLRGAITLNGQMCTSVARVLVERAALAEFGDRLAAALAAVRLGSPLDRATELGPLIDRAAQARALGHIARAAAEAQVIVKGTAPGGELAAGNFVSPTLFAIDNAAHSLVQEELFAPILSLEAFDDEDAAVARANATRYGLAASVHTRDLDRAMRMARRLKAGTVWLNCHNRLMAEAETGGYGESGLGRLHGVEGLNDFLQTKHIYWEST